ncbi:MAG: outer membrane beta-barrel family protein [Bacteroidia bacterium]|nr:outer membrane beta-barrel family protein [Bacteroidia bacterium]
MKNPILTIVFASLMCLPLCAQNLQGIVLDENDSPLEFATVALLSFPDSTIVGGGMADEGGHFEIELPHTASIVQISMIGYKMVELPVSAFAGAKTVRLTPDYSVLEGAVVSAQLPRTEIKGDAVVTNIAGSVLEHSGNALDVLGKIPGIINKGGELEVIGRGAPEYYINGRKVTDSSELRDLMSEDIKSVDVVSNPGALYGGTTRAVVRIRTVKRDGNGLSYALTSQAKQHTWSCDDFEPSWSVLDLNYRKKGWDLFGKLVYWNQRNYQISTQTGSTFLDGADGYHDFFQTGTVDYRGHNGGMQYIGGANWQISDKHSMGFKLGHDHNHIGDSKLLIDSEVYIDDALDDRISTVNDARTPISTQWTGNMYYDGSAGKMGINFNADFVSGRTDSFTEMHEHSLISPAELSSQSKARALLGAGKLILTHPIGKGSLQFGAEETYVAAAQTYSITFDEIPATDASLTENTVAGFAEYATTLSFGQISAGLRYEHAGFEYQEHLGDTYLKRTDDSWFPSLSFATMAGPVGLSLSYTGKTQRPDYNRLTTEISYNNRYVYQTGDPTLLNEKHRTVALNANWKWLTFSGNYERVDNYITQWACPYNDKGVVLVKNANLDVPLRKLNFYLIGSPTIGVWSPMYTIGVQKQFLTLNVEDPRAEGGFRTVSRNKPMYLAQLNNAFRFKRSWVLNADYFYYSRMETDIAYVYKPIQSASVSIQKSFLKDDALTFTLAWNDIFNSSVIYAKTDFGRYVIDQPNDNFNSFLTLRVSFRFNSTNSKYKGTGAGQDAKNRM